MLGRLPYRIQIPMGLSLAIVVAALLVTAVAAKISARTARSETMATVDRAIVLLAAQARPLLAVDDTWKMFVLLRNTAPLLPGGEVDRARAAILDASGRVVAGSDPGAEATSRMLMSSEVHGARLPAAGQVGQRVVLDTADGSLILVDPIRSEDGQTLGFVYIDIAPSVFAPDWAALSQPALIGSGLAVALLVPLGWWVGRRMTRPIKTIAAVIGRIGNEKPDNLKAAIPQTTDPELRLISDSVVRLIDEMVVRRQAEQLALSAERMAAVGRLTAAVAHEINNPLGGLLNATQTLKLHGGAETTRLQTVSLIERGLQQIRTTLAALVPQARIEDRPLETNDLADVVRLVLPVAQRRSIDIRSNADVACAIHVLSAPMRQVMLNLLLNAVKAAGEHGLVAVKLHANADYVSFDVTNTGERLTHDVLRQSIAAERGNDPRGFGLWVCREVATQFGGTFEVSDFPEAATHLVFRIPNQARHEIAAVS